MPREGQHSFKNGHHVIQRDRTVCSIVITQSRLSSQYDWETYVAFLWLIVNHTLRIHNNLRLAPNLYGSGFFGHIF